MIMKCNLLCGIHTSFRAFINELTQKKRLAKNYQKYRMKHQPSFPPIDALIRNYYYLFFASLIPTVSDAYTEL